MVYAQIPADGWYFGLFGTIVIPSFYGNILLTTNQANAVNSYLTTEGFSALSNNYGTIKYQATGGGGGEFGYRWCGLRLEAELLLIYDPFSNILLGGYTFDKSVFINNFAHTSDPTFGMAGHILLGGGLANVVYDFYNHDSDNVTWMPFLGVGAGFAFVENKWVINFLNPPGTTSPFFNIIRVRSKKAVPLGQTILGMGYQLDDYFSVSADYRYLTTFSKKKKLGVINNKLIMQTINFNFNYWFNA